jgi:hypothetical protein
MKKRGRAQISMEYILIVSLAFMILIPGVYLFRNYALESNDKVLERRLIDVSNQILVKAKKSYYYGPPSKSIVNPEMPPQINNMYVLDNSDNNEYYFVYTVSTTQGEEDVFFESDVPLKAGEDVLCENVHETCGTSNVTCECFPERYYSQGLKNFQVQASEDCISSTTCIQLKEISPQLS